MAEKRPPKISKETKRDLRDEIDSILGSIRSDQQDFVVDSEIAVETKKEHNYDFEKMGMEFTVKAKQITDSLFKTFVDIDLFKENDYAKHKKEMDTINVSNLFFQLKTIKIAIMKVMEEIASGNTHPRMIEAMGNLQDKFANITKIQANYILFLEETYQKINNGKPMNGDEEEIGNSPEEGQFFITVGTKNIVKNLPVTDDNIASSRVVGGLIDPRRKSEMMKDRNIQDDEKPTGEDFIDLDSMI